MFGHKFGKEFFSFLVIFYACFYHVSDEFFMIK